ncbi:conjugal transfer protein TraF [Helicobacter sp. 23-1045]
MKKLAFIALIVSNIFALEFGQLGNTPASVGGAGVAYKKNAWAVYYNPAILGANRNANIAYSFGVGYADSNVLELASIDVNSLMNLPKEIESLTKNPKTQQATQTQTQVKRARRSAESRNTQQADATTTNTWKFGDLGILGEVLGNLTGNGTTGGGGNGGGTSTDLTSDKLKEYLCGKVGSGTTTQNKAGKNGTDNCSLDNVKEKLSGNTTATEAIKKELGEAIRKTAESNPDSQTPLAVLESIVSGLDPSKIPDLVESVKGGKVELKDILTKVGGVSIARGASPALDSLFTISSVIDKNSLYFTSNNGIAWHIKGNKSRGAIGMGLFANAYAFAGVEMDSARKKIIVKANESDYFEVGVSGDKITLKTSGSDSYTSSSIMSPNANHKLHANGIVITEIPIAYGHTISLPVGDLHLGATLKYIFAISSDNTQKFNFEKMSFDTNISKNLRYTHNFGVDLGALYTMKWLGAGLVVKNLNAPTINTANGKYRILPQVRAGFSAEAWKLTFLLDMDLTPNKTLEPNKLNQMVGGGVILDLKWVDFRFGMMGDMHKNPYGPIFTAGMNIVHFLDFSIQSSAKLVDLGEYTNGLKMPNYFKVNFGGRFQW